MAVFEKVQEIIVEELGKDAEEVKVETTFDELDADSLGRVPSYLRNRR